MGRLTTAAKSGDRLKALMELRDILAARLENAAADRDIAALSRQFVQVTAEIEEIRAGERPVSSLMELRAKFKAASE